MSGLIISVSGLRGIVGESLTPEAVVAYTAAFHQMTPPGPVVLSRDGRTTGRMLADVVRGVLSAMGREVLDVDVAATPTVGVLVRQHAAAGAMQISASHNPPEYNGIKLFNAEGRVVPAEQGEQARQAYFEFRDDPQRLSDLWVAYQKVGPPRILEDGISAHAQAVLARVDSDAIRNRSFRVLLDSNHGAGGLLGRHLLEQLGCHVVTCGEQPTGQFAHPPEPTAENLTSITTRVTEAQAAVGFCQDPDADRLALIDETGRYIGEEYTLALCLDHVLQKSPGPVVTNCATSRMAEDLAEKYGATFHRSAVGEANVAQKMQEVSAVFGGEGNGGPIDPEVGYVRDSFVGMALILDALAARQQPLSAWADSLPRYAIRKSKVTLDPGKLADALNAVEKAFADARSDRSDGLRIDWPGRWLLIRPSNTEPIVRVIAEAPETEQADQMVRETAAILEQAVR